MDGVVFDDGDIGNCIYVIYDLCMFIFWGEMDEFCDGRLLFCLFVMLVLEEWRCYGV